MLSVFAEGVRWSPKKGERTKRAVQSITHEKKPVHLRQQAQLRPLRFASACAIADGAQKRCHHPTRHTGAASSCLMEEARADGSSLRERLAESLRTPGQVMVIDNRQVRSTTIGTAAVANRRPMGTSVADLNNLTLNTSFYQNTSFEPLKDFAPINDVRSISVDLVVHPSVSARAVKEADSAG